MEILLRVTQAIFNPYAREERFVRQKMWEPITTMQEEYQKFLDQNRAGDVTAVRRPNVHQYGLRITWDGERVENTDLELQKVVELTGTKVKRNLEETIIFSSRIGFMSVDQYINKDLYSKELEGSIKEKLKNGGLSTVDKVRVAVFEARPGMVKMTHEPIIRPFFYKKKQ